MALYIPCLPTTRTSKEWYAVDRCTVEKGFVEFRPSPAGTTHLNVKTKTRTAGLNVWEIQERSRCFGGEHGVPPLSEFNHVHETSAAAGRINGLLLSRGVYRRLLTHSAVNQPMGAGLQTVGDVHAVAFSTMRNLAFDGFF